MSIMKALKTGGIVGIVAIGMSYVPSAQLLKIPVIGEFLQYDKGDMKGLFVSFGAIGTVASLIVSASKRYKIPVASQLSLD